MNNINFEQIRLVFISTLSPVVGVLTPTMGFIYALVIMFAFNIWAGMRADGVSIITCKNFKFSKFRKALTELILYLVIIELIHGIMVSCGDNSAALVVVKSITYVFLYVYCQNAFKNLIIAYPKNVAIRIIYHCIRLEFTRMLPSYWKPIIERIEKDINNKDN